MATSAFNKFQDFSEQLSKGVHQFGTHVFKVALTNSAPVATNTILANITQIANGGGYTTGGATTTVTVSETTGTTTVSGTEVVWTGTSGGMAAFRYAVLYNDTATSPADALVGWFDYGSSITVSEGDTFTVKFSNASPGAIFTLA
jgi:hypothetical protein